MKKFNSIILVSCLLSSTAFATTLSEALIHTYQNNPELIASREQLKSTDEKMYQAVSGFLPKLKYVASKTNQKQDTKTANALTGQLTKTANWTHTKSKKSTLDLEQNIFNGGQTVMAVKMAKFTIDAGRQDLLAKEQDIFIKAITAYLDVVKTKQILEISKENYTAYEKRYDAVKDRVEVGVAKQAELADSGARRANASTNLAVAQGNYNAALASYVQIVGLEPDNIESSGSELTIAPANELELLQKSLESNPQLSNIALQKKIADINVVSNAAGILPSVDIGGSIGKNWQDTRGSTINQPYTNTKAVYVSVTVPIYNRGLEYSNIRSSSAEAARFKYLLKNTKAAITQGAVQAWNKYISAQESVKSAKEAVKAGVVALDAKQQEYNEGLETLTDLLNAQENLFQYQLKLAQVIEESSLSYYEMSSLMGTLNARDLDLPTKIYNVSENYDKIKFRLIGL